MTVSKSILTVSTLAFALMFGGGVYVLKNLSTLAKPVTERIMSDALGVRVNIGAMVISLQEKRVDVVNIRIANPAGFSKPHAVTVENAQVALNSAGKNLIDLKGIAVNGTRVYLEVKEGTTNLHALKSGLKASAPKDPEADPLKVIIRRFAMNEAQINPTVTLLSEQDLKPIVLAPVILKNIGVKENGVLANEAIAQIMAPLLKTFSNAAGKAGFYQGLSSEALTEMGLGQFNDIGTQIQDGIDKVGDSVKGLFQ